MPNVGTVVGRRTVGGRPCHCCWPGFPRLRRSAPRRPRQRSLRRPANQRSTQPAAPERQRRQRTRRRSRSYPQPQSESPKSATRQCAAARLSFRRGRCWSADILVKAVMISLAFASLVTWTIFIGKTLQLAAARARLSKEIGQDLANAHACRGATRAGPRKRRRPRRHCWRRP